MTDLFLTQKEAERNLEVSLEPGTYNLGEVLLMSTPFRNQHNVRSNHGN